MVWASVGLALLGSNSPTGVLSTYLYVFLYSLLNKELSLISYEPDNIEDHDHGNGDDNEEDKMTITMRRMMTSAGR